MVRNIPDDQDAPMRLRDAGGELGELLESADQQFQAGLGEGPAWRRLRERQHRRAVAGVAVLTAAVAGSLAAAAFVFRGAPGPGVTAERVLERSAEPGGQIAREQNPAIPGSARVVRIQRARPDPTLRPLRSASACRDFEARDRINEAVACFEQLGSSSGIEAEVALYEAGRLSADRLAQPQRAIGALDARRERFPNGAMQVEAEWLRARTLARSGKVQEALTASEALLGNPAGRTIANPLHLFRNKLYRDALHDCSKAVIEFVALLGEPGPIGDEGEFSRAICLESLGRREDARAAFETYLRRPEPAQAALAHEHLASIQTRSPAEP
jgi:tetratricopeptide (TPR) repeat protein